MTLRRCSHFNIHHNKGTYIEIMPKYLDKTEARVTAIFEAADTEFNVGQIKPMG